MHSVVISAAVIQTLKRLSNSSFLYFHQTFCDGDDVFPSTLSFYLAINTCFMSHSISLLTGGISLKLAVDIHHVSGYC